MLNKENEKSKAIFFYTDWSVIQIEFVKKIYIQTVYPPTCITCQHDSCTWYVL